MSRYRYRSDNEEKTEGHKFEWFGNNRHVCDALTDMRKCAETLNFSPLAGLIEEVQVMANRMESALSDQKDLVKLNQELSVARKAYKKLEREYKAIQAKLPKKPKAQEKS